MNKIMKHRKITAISCNNGNYTVSCLLGNFHITPIKVKNKNMYKLYTFSSSAHSQSLVRKYDKEMNREEIYYKSVDDITNAIEKECNSFYNNTIKFYFEEK